MLKDKLKQIKQPKTLDELFNSSKEQILFERLNKSLQEVVLRFKEQVKTDLKQMIAEITKQELSGISADNLKKEADKVINEAEERLDKISSKIVDDAKITKNAILELRSVLESEKVNKDKDKKEIIDIKTELENIRNNLPNLIRSLIPRKASGGGTGGGGSTIRVDNLSSQCNGATRSFTTTHRIGEARLLFYSSFPTLFLPETDFTTSGTTVTLNSALDFPAAGQSLAIIYESSD